MNILIISQCFWPENFRINDLALGLQEKGHAVTVLTGMPNYPGGTLYDSYKPFSPLQENFNGIKVIRTPIITRGKSKGNYLRLSLNYISFVLSATVSLWRLRRHPVDVILVYGTSPPTQAIPAILLKKIKKAPLFFYVQDLWPESVRSVGAMQSNFWLNQLKKVVQFIYRHSDYLLVQSEGFIAQLIEFGVSRERIYYLPNTAEALYEPVDKAQCIEQSALVPNGFVVMFAGNLGVAQDFPTILAAAERLKKYTDLHWVILGNGSQRDYIAEQIKQRQLDHVHLLGSYPVEQMPKFFALADVMLVTLKNSPIFELTLPAKVQSYLACAKPIVGAIDGVGAQVIEAAQAGLVVPAEDSVGLARIIEEIYHLPLSQRAVMGDNAKSFFETHYKRSVLLDRLERYLSSAVQK